MKAIGLMSGTSLDGLDIAYCDIQGNYTDTKVKLLDYREVKMPHHLKEKIQYCCQTDGGHVQDICSLNFELVYQVVYCNRDNSEFLYLLRMFLVMN